MNRKTFFASLFEFCEGKIEIRPLPGKPLFFEIDDFGAIDDYCLRMDKTNVFFGVATRDGKGGRKENIVDIPACWADVDFKDVSMKDFAELLKRFPYKPSSIILSGGGVHLYWFLSEPIQRQEIPIIEDINRRIASKLHGDLNSCDAARILRVPETWNLKYKDRFVKIHRLDGFHYEPDNFLEVLPEVKREVKEEVKEVNNLVDIVKRCNFLKWCAEHPAKVPEPLWYAMISNLIAIRPGGYQLCHQLSKGHPGYSKDETDRKILHSLSASAPHSCQFIQMSGFDCRMFCNVKSPVVLFLYNEDDRRLLNREDLRAEFTFK